MAQFPGRVESGDAYPIIDGASWMLSELSRGHLRKTGPFNSPLDGIRISTAIAPVVKEAEIPPRGRFTEKQIRGFAERGVFVGAITLENGIGDANAKFRLKLNDPGFESYLESPRITQVAFPVDVSSFDVPDNRGRSFAEQRAYVARYVADLADSMGVRGEISGVIGFASEIHQGLARHVETFGRLPIDNSSLPHIRTESSAGSGLGVVLKLEKDRLVPAAAPRHTGLRVNEGEGVVIAWPMIMPVGALA